MYNISDVNQEKPISVMIKKTEEDPSYSNKISIIIKVGSDSTTCEYKSYDDLCVINKLSSKNISMTVKC